LSTCQKQTETHHGQKALCIGINNYPGTHMDLQGCVNDAQDWAAALAERGYKTTLLLDDQATKAAMVDAMSKLIASGAKGDSLIITYSGHGTYQPDTDGDEVDGLDEALCPYDLQTNGSALIDDEIKTLFAARKGGVRPADCRQLPLRHGHPRSQDRA
jgi:hypothetical protein